MRPKGSKKTPGSGRKKGSRNVRTILFRSVKESMDRKGFNPSDLIADAGLGKLRGKNSDLRLKAAELALRYMAPQYRSVELTGPQGGPLQHGPIQIVIDYGADEVSGEVAETSSGSGESIEGGEEI